MPYYESFPEFASRQECDYLSTSQGFLFRNGAYSDGKHSHIDPPTDPIARLKRERLFLSTKLSRVVEQFDSLKSHTAEQASLHRRYPNLPAPDERAPAELKRLKNIVDRIKQQIVRIDEQLAQTPEAKRRRELAELEAKVESRAQAVATSIAGIEL